MEQKYKAFLESAFRSIAPTKAAKEYRVKLYKDMMARAQELRIKGMTDEDLIVDTVLEDYEDIQDRLADFEDREVKVNSFKRNALFGVIISAVAVVLLSLTFVLVGSITIVFRISYPAHLS